MPELRQAGAVFFMPTPAQDIALLRDTMRRMRDNYESQLTILRQARDAANLRANEAQRLKGDLQRSMVGRGDLAGIQQQAIESLHEENDRLRAALSASRELRTDAVRPLTVWVAAEDNESLPEEDYMVRIDAALREARTVLSRNVLLSAAVDGLLRGDE